MGVHVVGELRVELNSGLWPEDGISIRCVPEKTTNDLGIPVVVQTDRGDIQLHVCIGRIEIPLGDDVILCLYRDGERVVASLRLPMRGYLSYADVCSIRSESFAGNRDWSREEYPARLSKALQEAVRPHDPNVVTAQIFRDGPLVPGWWRRLGKNSRDED